MRFFILLLTIIPLALAAGCGRAPESAAATEAQAAEGIRIVSLSPAISRTLIDLEMDQLIVGRTPFCDSIDRSITVVGDLVDLDYESLIRVGPTHVLVQPPASGINQRLVQLAQERGWSLHSWRLDGLADIGKLIGQLPEAVFGDDYEAQATPLRNSAALIGKLSDLFTGEAPPERPMRTMLVVGTEPVMVYGTGTYLHEIMLALGKRNAVDLNGYPQLTLEDVTRLNPQAIIIVKPGGSADQGTAFGPLRRLEVEAVRENRLAILTHKDALLPSSGVIGVAEELRVVLESFRESGE